MAGAAGGQRRCGVGFYEGDAWSSRSDGNIEERRPHEHVHLHAHLHLPTQRTGLRPRTPT